MKRRQNEKRNRKKIFLSNFEGDRMETLRQNKLDFVIKKLIPTQLLRDHYERQPDIFNPFKEALNKAIKRGYTKKDEKFVLGVCIVGSEIKFSNKHIDKVLKEV